MHLACFAFGLFAAAFLTHWLWWRIHVPRRQTAMLLAIFISVLAVGLIVSPRMEMLAAWRPRGAWQILHVCIFHIAMTLAYVVAYSALEERSPSMTMLLHVAAAKGHGRTRDELFAALGEMTPLRSRLDAMVRDHMLEAHEDGYRITAKGIAWARVFGSWRRLIGLAKGG